MSEETIKHQIIINYEEHKETYDIQVDSKGKIKKHKDFSKNKKEQVIENIIDILNKVLTLEHEKLRELRNLSKGSKDE